LSFLEINPNMQELDRSRAHALERSNSCMFGSFTAGSFQRPLHTCAILYGHSTMNDQYAKHCDWAAIDIVTVYYHCWILPRPAENVFFVIRIMSKKCHITTNSYMSVFSCETGDSLTGPDCP
jgi:hypothetical protein